MTGAEKKMMEPIMIPKTPEGLNMKRRRESGKYVKRVLVNSNSNEW